MSDAWLDLSDAIEGLRQALTEAIDRGAGHGMQFELSPVELTLQAALTREGQGKVGWKVIEAGGSVESATTQTLKLSLRPVWRRQDGSVVRDFTISDIQSGSGPQAFGPHPGSDGT